MDVHIVVKGDTLWKIARQYGISFEDLKRVNAHLANPDYIVPGMKIFLPKKKTDQMPGMKGPDKKPQQVKPTTPTGPTTKPEKPSTQTKPSKPTKPMEPIPLPPTGGEQVKPKPQPMPPVSKPTPPAMPMPPVEQKPAPPTQAPQLPPMVMPHFYQPIVPVPCGWMPIYDADCYPMSHPGFTQPIHAPEMSKPMYDMKPQMPTPPAHMGTKPPAIEMTEEMDEFDLEESPIYPGMGVGTPPSYPTSGWELMESPSFPQLESPDQMVYCPPEQGYVPQMISPEYQNPYGMMMYPQEQFGHCQPCPPMHHYGCGPQGYYPNQMMPMQGMHMQPMPMQSMQMPGMYMQPMPMQMPGMQPMRQMPMNPNYQYNQTDNYGCGSC